MEDIDERIREFMEASMNLGIKDGVAGFLGVHINCLTEGTISMAQVGLMDRIITALIIGDMYAKRTLVEFGCLGKNQWEDPCQGTYNYA
jgi:hypothetical protein